jgi:hypothetical protein
MTWTISPSELLAGDNPVTDALGRFYKAFVEMFDTDLTLEQILPFYVRQMPYYQRLYASALSRSIRGSATLGGQAALKCRQWQLQLPPRERLLVSHAETPGV